MRRLIALVLMFALVFATGAITKAFADVSFHVGKDRGYGFRDDRFSSWDARQRERIDRAMREGSITNNEYSRLSEEVSNVENFHDQAFSNGRGSDKARERLERMEARVDSDIEREISEHRY